MKFFKDVKNIIIIVLAVVAIGGVTSSVYLATKINSDANIDAVKEDLGLAFDNDNKPDKGNRENNQDRRKFAQMDDNSQERTELPDNNDFSIDN